MEAKVKELIKSIKDSKPANSNSDAMGSCRKDEVRVMRAMLNDTSFKVGVYSNKGKEGEFCPAETAKSLVGNIIFNATKISKNEANAIAENYTFTNSDATKLVEISKEFINTYTDCGRKINLGKREDSNISLHKKVLEAHERNYPKPVFDKSGKPVMSKEVDKNGNPKQVYETGKVKVPKHATMRVTAKCPEHLKSSK